MDCLDVLATLNETLNPCSMKNLYTTFAASALALTSYSQLTITPTPDQTTLKSLLQGFGVVIGNVQIHGDQNAYGSFFGNSEIPINEGLILSTGNVSAIADSASHFASTDLGNAGYAPLNDLVTSTGNDAIVLEFDAQSTGDTLMFNFVFGSEEYPEFAPPNTSTFNDVFAVFMSGPGLAGTINAATLPNGTVVSINNVNPITNSEYYINNGVGEYVVFDGITQNINVKRKVTPGATYHFAIAIQDVADAFYDSGIMLQSHSFRSNGPAASVNELNTLEVMVGPNPCTDVVALQFNSTEAEVELYNMAGVLIQQMSKVPNGSTINTQNLEAGIYTLRITADGNSVSKRLVRQ